MNRYFVFAVACILVATVADPTSAIGRRRRSTASTAKYYCPPMYAPQLCETRANPCVCPWDEILKYWTGSGWNSLYSAIYHDDFCGCEGGACDAPESSYLTGYNVTLHQDCDGEVACDPSSHYPLRAQTILGLHHPVPYDHVPSATAPTATGPNEPYFGLHDGTVTPTAAGTPRPIAFQKAPGGPFVLAKVYHFLIPEHDGRPPQIASVGYQCDPKNAPAPKAEDIVAYDPKKVRNKPLLGRDLYLVTVGHATYGIVIVARP